MKTLTVKLKQHTPLIHFQHDQYDATLRASEVKPKLDRYIIDEIFKNDWHKCKEFLVGYKKSRKESEEERNNEEEKFNQVLKQKFDNGFRALNYKMKIEVSQLDKSIKLCDKEPKEKYDKKTKKIKTIFSLEDFPMLLSNMGGKENKSDLVNFSFSSSSREVDVTITFFDNKGDEFHEDNGLYDVIKEKIRYFFANKNFGQRSTKGFGSFTVFEIDNEPIKWDNNDVFENDTKVIRYDVDVIDFDSIKTLFEVIDFYWRSLKSGINCTKREIRNENVSRKFPERYIKSFLWTYLDKKKKTWEKRKIKNDLSLECNRPKTETIASNNNPAFFARAHLGCSISGFTYKIPQSKLIEVDGRKKEDVKTVEVKINADNNNIERIASPILFKPVFHKVIDNNTKKPRDVVSIYILYDKYQIRSLYQNTPDTLFYFNENKKSTSVPLFVNDEGERFEIDFHDLITEFHRSLKFELEPRNYRWEKILGENKIKLLKTVKK